MARLRRHRPFQGTSLAVLSSLPIPCGSDDHLDITCVYERPLEPGESRIVVGVLPYRSGSILDRLDIDDGATTRLSMGGMPAILDERDETPDDFYLADDTATWSIGTPESLTRVVQLDFQGREPGVADARAAADAIAASFRFTPPPTPLPDDPAAASSAARAALDAEAASFRTGFVPGDDTTGQTFLDCLPAAPGEDHVVGIDYGPGGDLGWTVLARCRWTVVVDDHGPFWRIDTVYEWTVGETSAGTANVSGSMRPGSSSPGPARARCRPPATRRRPVEPTPTPTVPSLGSLAARGADRSSNSRMLTRTNRRASLCSTCPVR